MADSLDDKARAAAAAIIVAKRDALMAERGELLEQRTGLIGRLRQVDQEIADCRSAARLFSLEIDLPPEDPADAQRETIIFQQNQMAVQRARQLATARAAATETPTAPPPSSTTAPPQSFTSPRPSLRQILLDQLKLAGAPGSKAVPLREYFQSTYGLVIHEKTVGMTLYRLLKEGLVHRDGHTWFFGPASAETENPGGETPGSDNHAT
jgi:hypothetical protein